MMPEISQILTNVQFWTSVIHEAKRTWICPPRYEDQIRQLVEAHGLSHTITVKSSVGCPEHLLLIVDEQAMQADRNQMMNRKTLFGRPT